MSSMDPDGTTTPRVRPTRAERQRETREALITAALSIFTRDGYQGASLEEIANEAGYSKGAVYSNFDGKAELFLAVMDHNLEWLRGHDWDPFATPQPYAGAVAASPADEREATETLRSFGLATLEFIGVAARDDRLMRELRARLQALVDTYQRVATTMRPADEHLPAEDVAQLMVAMDQGMSILMLAGVAPLDGTLLRTGQRRLLDPASEPPQGPDEATTSLPDVEQIRRLLIDTPDDASSSDT